MAILGQIILVKNFHLLSRSRARHPINPLNLYVILNVLASRHNKLGHQNVSVLAVLQADEQLAQVPQPSPKYSPWDHSITVRGV